MCLEQYEKGEVMADCGWCHREDCGWHPITWQKRKDAEAKKEFDEKKKSIGPKIEKAMDEDARRLGIF